MRCHAYSNKPKRNWFQTLAHLRLQHETNDVQISAFRSVSLFSFIQSCVSQIKSGESYHIDDIHKINIFLATTHGKIKHPGWHWPYFLRKWTSSSKVVPKSRRNGFVPTPMARRWLYPFHIYHETNLVNMKQTGKPLLVGGWPTPLKNMSSSVGITIPIIWKVIKFHGSTPPTRLWCWRKSHNSPT